MPKWEKSIYYALIVFSMAVGVYELNVFRHYMVDDAFISLRYVRNALEGYGLVYNIGEKVEGFTSPLHILLTYILGRFGLNLVLASKILGVMSFLLILGCLCIWGSIRKTGQFLDLPSFVVTFSIVITSFSLTFFAITGMETVIFSCLTLLVFVDATRLEITFRSISLIFIAFLCRPEGITFLPWIMLAIFWVRKADSRLAISSKKNILYFKQSEIWAIGAFLLAVATFEFVRWMYYGALLPNTFFAKAPWTMESGTTHWSLKGLGSIIYFFSASGGVLGVLLFLAALARKQDSMGILLLVSALTLSQLFFQKFAGSDWMIGARYLIPVLPVWAIGLGVSIVVLDILKPLSRLLRCAAVSVIVIMVATMNFSDTRQFLRNIQNYPNNVQASVGLRQIGSWIKQNVPQDYRVRNWRIGAIGYYCDNPIIDTWGLVNKEVARLRFQASSEDEGNRLVLANVEKMRP
jgi:arabinofuranosyltransferase